MAAPGDGGRRNETGCEHAIAILDFGSWIWVGAGGRGQERRARRIGSLCALGPVVNLHEIFTTKLTTVRRSQARWQLMGRAVPNPS
jgi:hypothetical protein